MSHLLLLIEDSPTQIITIRKQLESNGYKIISARTVAEGLVLAYDHHPDLIISDIVMSEINGYQLCRLVKSDPELSSIPVILLTKLDGSIDRFWGMKSGADRFIPKEPGFPTLLKATKDLLDNSADIKKVNAAPSSDKAPTTEEINHRLNQLLERLLFEATIVEEVRSLIDSSLDAKSIVEKLFDLMSSILDYEACAIAINEANETNIFLDTINTRDEEAISSYIDKMCRQLGMPATNLNVDHVPLFAENIICQTIDMQGNRLGLLFVIPRNDIALQPGDLKVVRIICDHLSFVLKLYLETSTQKI